MSRDHRKLRVFHLADRVVIDIYRVSGAFPPEERYGLVAQLRRASVSTAVNIVEGSARLPEGEYVQFLNIALGSASEVRSLLELSTRLGYLQGQGVADISDRSDELVRSLKNLVGSYRKPPASSHRKPPAASPRKPPAYS